MFSGVTGQIGTINSTLKGFDHEEFHFTKAAGVYNTMLIDGERVPGASSRLRRSPSTISTPSRPARVSAAAGREVVEHADPIPPPGQAIG